MMRIDDRQRFEYLLGRGIMSSIADNEGYNALHYAVRMEKLHYISFLLDGNYDGFDCELEDQAEFTKL